MSAAGAPATGPTSLGRPSPGHKENKPAVTRRQGARQRRIPRRRRSQTAARARCPGNAEPGGTPWIGTERNGTKRKVTERNGTKRKVSEPNGTFRDPPEIRKSLQHKAFPVLSRESGYAGQAPRTKRGNGFLSGPSALSTSHSALAAPRSLIRLSGTSEAHT